MPASLHGISVFILCSLSLLPLPAIRCLSAQESMGFALEVMISPLRRAVLLTSPLVWRAGYLLETNWTFLQICLLRAIKYKNTNTTSGYGSICALDFLQTRKMYQGNTITHTQPCYILSLSIYLLLTVVRGNIQGRQTFALTENSHIYIPMSLSTTHAKNMEVKPALNHRIPVWRLILKNELTFFCQVLSTDHCQKGTLS